MLLAVLLLASASQASIADYNREQAVADVYFVEMKLFDMRREARCLQCRGDVDVDYDLAFQKKCAVECFATRPSFLDLIKTARVSEKSCHPYKVAKIVFRHDERLRSLITVDYTGTCISIEAVDYRTSANVLQALMQEVDVPW